MVFKAAQVDSDDAFQKMGFTKKAVCGGGGEDATLGGSWILARTCLLGLKVLPVPKPVYMPHGH